MIDQGYYSEISPRRKRVVNLLLLSVFTMVAASSGFLAHDLLIQSGTNDVLSPVAKVIQSRPLDEFSFDSLSSRIYPASEIVTEEVLAEEEGYVSELFSYSSLGRKVTGQINVPLTPSSKLMPVVIMLRGYVDQEIYQTGLGTKNAAAVFAENGYVTVAPDFLGYGGSDNPENDVFWERLTKPVIVLDLIESVKKIEYVDPNNIFIWAHSNGGQIALSVLEIAGQPYPTTLWAPVSKGFPYNILFFTDEFDDYGKSLRREISRFELKYDTDLYSIHNYWNKLNAPIQIHQGTVDDAVPVEWSRELFDVLDELQESTESGELLSVDYYEYAGADHNLRPSWNTVIQRDLSFFEKYLTF